MPRTVRPGLASASTRRDGSRRTIRRRPRSAHVSPRRPVGPRRHIHVALRVRAELMLVVSHDAAHSRGIARLLDERIDVVLRRRDAEAFYANPPSPAGRAIVDLRMPPHPYGQGSLAQRIRATTPDPCSCSPLRGTDRRNEPAEHPERVGYLMSSTSSRLHLVPHCGNHRRETGGSYDRLPPVGRRRRHHPLSRAEPESSKFLPWRGPIPAHRNPTVVAERTASHSSMCPQTRLAINPESHRRVLRCSHTSGATTG